MDHMLVSLRKQLAEAEENLRLIRERKSEYVEPHEIDLQLVKNEHYWERYIADLKAKLEQLMSDASSPLFGPERVARGFVGRETEISALT